MKRLLAATAAMSVLAIGSAAVAQTYADPSGYPDPRYGLPDPSGGQDDGYGPGDDQDGAYADDQAYGDAYGDPYGDPNGDAYGDPDDAGGLPYDGPGDQGPDGYGGPDDSGYDSAYPDEPDSGADGGAYDSHDAGAPQYAPYEQTPPRPTPPPPPRDYGGSQPPAVAEGATAIPDDLIEREDRLERRIRSGGERGLVPAFHVDNLLVQLDSIRAQQEELAARDGGLTHTTRTFISSRIDRLEANVTW